MGRDEGRDAAGDEFVAAGVGKRLTQDLMAVLDGLRGERASFLAGSLQERSVTRGDVRRAELLQLERAQRRMTRAAINARYLCVVVSLRLSVATSIHERR